MTYESKYAVGDVVSYDSAISPMVGKIDYVIFYKDGQPHYGFEGASHLASEAEIIKKYVEAV
jgi:hypothetical protein